VRRPPFDLENALHRPGVQRVGSQPINRLGRKCGHLSRAQEFRRAMHRRLEQPGRVRRQNLGDNWWRLFHGGNLPATAPKAREKSRPGAAQIARARSGLAAYPALGRTHLLGDISPLVSPLPLRSLAVVPLSPGQRYYGEAIGRQWRSRMRYGRGERRHRGRPDDV